ncbi:hypothetical protein B0H66DRAFT_472065 [Apodospora peruviana]|uniref:FAD-binding PCMH-type domain-containing protein n=1 Tax=Apodospora peruviana TaxID=516989 RepID=A0AAE0IGW5_9PEZI|nr:hypothetical protein B0H66DRAFT_472065 [Apodospora peruviana]
MIFNRVSLLALQAAAAAAWPHSSNLTGTFASGLSPGASVYLPSDPEYETQITQRWSTWDEPTYVVAIKPATVADIQFIVKTANRLNIPYLATGGAHAAEIGLATVKNAVNIDLGNLKGVTLDTTTNKVTVGPGNVFSDLYDPLYNAGREVQTGNAACVNIIGATVGAGVGPMQGMHGLVIDALQSVTLVTAAGNVVTASDTVNKDLFWAVRGAGANFGIIVSATYGVHPATNGGQLINGDFLFNPATNGSLWEVLHSWDSEDVYSPKMAMTLGVSFNHSNGQPLLTGNIGFFGTDAEFKPFLDKLVALNPVFYRTITVPWNGWSTVAGFGNAIRACDRGDWTNHYSVGVKQTDVATFTSFFNDITQFTAARPWYNPEIAFQRYNSKVTMAVPKAKQGVYPWRDIRMLVALTSSYDGPAHDAEVQNFMKPWRTKFQAASGFSVPHVYNNYGYGDEGAVAWWSAANLPKLITLKKLWDPLNKFGAANPIPI